MATIELDTKHRKEKGVIAYDPDSTKKSRQGGDIVERAEREVSWQCKKSGDSYLVWFLDFATDAEAWPFTDGGIVIQPPPVPGITKYLRVNSTTAIKLKLLNTGSDIVPIKYFARDENNSNGVGDLDPMIVIRPMSVVPAPSSNGVLLGVVCAVLGAAVGAAVAYAMMS